MSTSPTDQIAERMDQSAFACVPRHLVEEFQRLLKRDTESLTMGGAFAHVDEVNAAARAIADAALDDIA